MTEAEIHTLTVDLWTADSQQFQVALPPTQRPWDKIDVLRQLQGESVMRLHNRDHEQIVLQGDSIIVTSSEPHVPDYERTIWFYEGW